MQAPSEDRRRRYEATRAKKLADLDKRVRRRRCAMPGCQNWTNLGWIRGIGYRRRKWCGVHRGGHRKGHFCEHDGSALAQAHAVIVASGRNLTNVARSNAASKLRIFLEWALVANRRPPFSASDFQAFVISERKRGRRNMTLRAIGICIQSFLPVTEPLGYSSLLTREARDRQLASLRVRRIPSTRPRGSWIIRDVETGRILPGTRT